MHALITNPEYKIPHLAPDVNYCPSNNIIGDLNNDEIINILDVIQIVNIVLSGNYEDNADMNNVDNIEFYCGDLKDIFTDKSIEKLDKPDVYLRYFYN